MTDAWRNRIVGTGEVEPDQLLANPMNWRIHPERQQTALGAILDEVGWVQTVTVNRATGFVVDGHLRVALAISREEPTVPVTFVDLTPAEEAFILSTFDPIGRLAVTDRERLEELAADATPSTDAALAALALLTATASAPPPDDPDPPPPEYPDPDALPVPGDGYREQYGVIVICADAAEQEDVFERLQHEGYTVRVVVT